MEIDELLASLMKTEKPPKFPLSMYYTEGTKYLNLYQYEKAVKFLNEALEHDPVNVKTLLKRSKCYIGLKEYKKAIDDSDKVLQICTDNVHAIDLKGQAQYLMGDFEGGYLTYLEGRKISPASQVLRLGGQLCQDALENSLHPHRKVRFHKGDVSNITKPEKDDNIFQKRLKYRKSIRDCFGSDTKFMEDLISNKNLKSVHGFCKEAMDYIKDCERFWCMETPLQSRKKNRQIKVKEITKTSEFEKHIRICNAAKRRSEFALHKGRIDYCISEANNLLNLTEYFLGERETEKIKLKCDAYHLLSLAYEQLNNLPSMFQYLMKELEIATKFNLAIQQVKIYHHLGVRYHHVGDTERTIYCFNKVIDAMRPEKVDELVSENASAEEKRQVQEAHEWVKSVMDEIKMVLQQQSEASLQQSPDEIKADMLKETVETEQPKTQDEKIVTDFSTTADLTCLKRDGGLDQSREISSADESKSKSQEEFFDDFSGVTDTKESTKSVEASDKLIRSTIEKDTKTSDDLTQSKLTQELASTEFEKIKELHELNEVERFKTLDDESIIKKILEEIIESITTEDAEHLPSISEEKSIEYTPLEHDENKLMSDKQEIAEEKSSQADESTEDFSKVSDAIESVNSVSSKDKLIQNTKETDFEKSDDVTKSELTEELASTEIRDIKELHELSETEQFKELEDESIIENILEKIVESIPMEVEEHLEPIEEEKSTECSPLELAENSLLSDKQEIAGEVSSQTDESIAVEKNSEEFDKTDIVEEPFHLVQPIEEDEQISFEEENEDFNKSTTDDSKDESNKLE